METSEMLTSYGSKEARQQWRKILDKILLRQGDVLIKRNNLPVAVMIPATDYLLIQEELELKREAEEAQSFLESWRAGQEETVTLDEMYEALGIEKK
jgi:PHD/YefM family antitoxin component YafN of YafNO toxin-antitoxin module